MALQLPAPTQTVRALHMQPDRQAVAARTLPEETAVALVYDGSTHAVMMTSPVDLQDFAVGFSLTEGIIRAPDEIAAFQAVAHAHGIEARMWLVRSRSGALLERRHALVGPVGCGLCGIESLEQAVRELPDLSARSLSLSVTDVLHAVRDLRRWQPLRECAQTLHAAGFLQPGRGIVLAREDVGRHNALDKLVGALARQGTAARDGAVVLSSRVSVEMVQKTAMVGASFLIACASPTAHALRLAEQAGMTLVACARGAAFEVFTHPWRLNREVCDVA